MTQDTQKVVDLVHQRRERYLEELKDYLRIPSISTDPAYRDQVRRCAEFLRARMTEAGLAAELIETSGHPLVYGERLGVLGKPTVLFYGHYDVQPPDPLEEWRHPPFEPAIEGDHLLARGATDDKGQSYTHLKAVDALLEARGSLPVNVKFLVEGEEESGGGSIEQFVRGDAGHRLACDCVVVSDTSMVAPGIPSLLYGLRGMLYTQIEVRGPSHDLHSGTYGGALTNPLFALVEALAALRDSASGKVKIPGFYDQVRPLEDWEREAFARVPFTEETFRAEMGVSELFGERGFTTLERVWTRPTCDINGIWGGYQGAGGKTVIPGSAGAKVSMRLVPDQDPGGIAQTLEKYLQGLRRPGVEMRLQILSSAAPVQIEIEGPFVDAAMDAMEAVWGARPLPVRDGGSIPIVSTFDQVLGAPILLLGFGARDDRLHSPNEKFDLPSFYKGIESIVTLLDHLGELGGSR